MGGSPCQPAPGLHSCHMGVYGPIHLPSPLTEAQDVRVLSWPATSHPERTTGGCASESLERRDATAPVLPPDAPRHSLAIRFRPADSAQPVLLMARHRNAPLPARDIHPCMPSA